MIIAHGSCGGKATVNANSPSFFLFGAGVLQVLKYGVGLANFAPEFGNRKTS